MKRSRLRTNWFYYLKQGTGTTTGCTENKA